jgi:hypothetical protein
MEDTYTALRDPLEESLHYLIISVIANSLENEGFTVAADHIGGPRPRPSAIGDFVPDIEARRGEEVHLIEVETQSTLASPRTHNQLSSLGARAGVRAYVAVPFDCIENARTLRRDLKLTFGILPCYPFVRYVGVPK